MAATNYRLTNISVRGIKIIPQYIQTIHIYEGLDVPGMTGRMYFSDWDGIMELQEVMAGDPINIALTSLSNDAVPLEFRGIVHSADNSKATSSHTAPIICLHFMSEWLFNASVKQVSKAYKNMTAEEIIEDLLVNECGANFQGMYPSPSHKYDRFVTPLWSPLHTIKYMLSYTGDDDGNAGYIIYDSLYEQDPVVITLKELYEGVWGERDASLRVSTENIQYEGNVTNIDIESYFNSLNYLDAGAWKKDIVSFDFDRYRHFETDSNISDANLSHLSAFMPLANKYATSEYSSKGFDWGFTNTSAISDKRKYEDGIKNIQNRFYSSIYSDMIKLNMQLPGATTRSCGQIVKLDFPSVNSQADLKARHAQLEGKYLIRNIHHEFTPDFFNQYVTLINDGFFIMSRNDLVKW
jgi:hypothetical protein